MPAPTIDAIGVVVSDMPTAVRFYQRVGCTFAEGAEKEAHAEADLGSVRLMLDTEELIRGFDPEWSASGAGRISLAVRCADPAEVDRLYAELAADGAGLREPWDAFWGQRYAQVRDPDGNHVDLYAPLPG
jgi:uncharacterized glyoxalase superfamily protein PhnB